MRAERDGNTASGSVDKRTMKLKMTGPPIAIAIRSRVDQIDSIRINKCTPLYTDSLSDSKVEKCRFIRRKNKENPILEREEEKKDLKE